MKLYHSPGSCSLSPHIVLREAGYDFELERVDGMKKKTQTGADYLAVNPNGYVPALRLDDGSVLTEGAAIVQFLADGKPESKLAPPAGTMERYRLMETLNFVATEIHKGYSPLFNPKLADDAKQVFKDRLALRFEYLEKRIGPKPYLMGEAFTVADAYLFTVLRWSPHVGIDLARWPMLTAYVERIGERPKVKEALEAERPR